MAFQIDTRADARTQNIPHHTAAKAEAVKHEAARAEIAEVHKKEAERQEQARKQIKELEPVLRELEQTSSFLHRRLKYSINSDLNRVIIKVVDADTDKVIKELPPEELQRISMRIREAVGLLIDEEI